MNKRRFPGHPVAADVGEGRPKPRRSEGRSRSPARPSAGIQWGVQKKAPRPEGRGRPTLHTRAAPPPAAVGRASPLPRPGSRAGAHPPDPPPRPPGQLASPGARPRPTCAPSSSSVCPSSSSSAAAVAAAAAPRGTSGWGGLGRWRRGAGAEAAAAEGAWRRRVRGLGCGRRGRAHRDRLARDPARGRRWGRGGGSTRPRCVSRPRWQRRRQPRDG